MRILRSKKHVKNITFIESLDDLRTGDCVKLYNGCFYIVLRGIIGHQDGSVVPVKTETSDYAENFAWYKRDMSHWANKERDILYVYRPLNAESTFDRNGFYVKVWDANLSEK